MDNGQWTMDNMKIFLQDTSTVQYARWMMSQETDFRSYILTDE